MECSAIPARVIATCFALVGFAAAVVVGVFAGNGTSIVIWRALITMGLCWCVGRVIGAIAQNTVEQEIARYKEGRPIPEVYEPSEDEEEPDPQETTADGRSAIATSKMQTSTANV